MRADLSLLSLLLATCWLIACPDTVRAETPVDLELVLCVDASGSVDDKEFTLQLAGVAAAFRDETLQEAMRSGPLQRIAVQLVVWADASTPKDQSEWHLITDAFGALTFADIVDRFPRRVEGGTGIGSAIAYSMRSMEFNEYTGTRRVVDVSGDGVETPVRTEALLLPDARNMAKALGITINALAIVNEVHNLDDYFREKVRIGPGSFVMTARNYKDFRTAIREKLLREVAAKVASAR